MQPSSPRPSAPVRGRTYTSSMPLPPRPSAMPPTRPQPVVPVTKPGRRHRFSPSPRLVSVVLVIVGLAVISGLGIWRSGQRPALPSAVAEQLSFGVYFPTTKTTIARVDKHTISYQASSGLLGYTATLTDGTTVSVNQQATPESFVDIPQAYEKLVSSLQPYSSFDSINGKVSLTHPKELQGGQSAVMNAKGTLLFARPSKSLTNDQWRQLFNGLFAQQIPAAK